MGLTSGCSGAGTIKVAGKTTREVRDMLSQRMSKVIENVQLDVRIVAFRSKRVYVVGEVKQPGLQPINDIQMAMLEAITDIFPNVRITTFENRFLVNYAHGIDAHFIVRGIRTASDYEYERSMRYINSDLRPSISTVFLMPPREFAEVSSTMVKGMGAPNGWRHMVRRYLPQPVYDKILSDHEGSED